MVHAPLVETGLRAKALAARVGDFPPLWSCLNTSGWREVSAELAAGKPETQSKQVLRLRHNARGEKLGHASQESVLQSIRRVRAPVIIGLRTSEVSVHMRAGISLAQNGAWSLRASTGKCFSSPSLTFRPVTGSGSSGVNNVHSASGPASKPDLLGSSAPRIGIYGAVRGEARMEFAGLTWVTIPVSGKSPCQ